MKPGRAAPFDKNSTAGTQVPSNTFNNNLSLNSSIKTDKDVLDFLLLKLSSKNNATRHSINPNIINPYTEIGEKCILYTALPFNSSGVDKETIDNDKSKQYSSSKSSSLPSHLFNLVSSAFLHMSSLGEDQSIICCGESKSGKTLSNRLIARHLMDLSKGSCTIMCMHNFTGQSKKTKIQSAILKMDCVLNQFTSVYNPSLENNVMIGDDTSTSSCQGRYIEYQFSEQNIMVGAKLLPFFLDKSKLTEPSNTSNFLILHHLLSGSTVDEKKTWQLIGNKDSYTYLKDRPYIQGMHDNIAFEELRYNLKLLGIGRRQQAQLFQILAAILHLGNITFHEATDNNRRQEECYVFNTAALVTAATLLGVSPQALESVLTIKTKYIKLDFISVLLDVDGAEEQRDALARTLYGGVVNWITEQINQKLCKDEQDWKNFIAVIDYPGFSCNPEMNDFNKLLQNYTSDYIHGFARDQLFVQFANKYTNEGIQLPNSVNPELDILNFLQGTSDVDDPGLFKLIDIETNKSTKSSKMTEKIYNAYRSSSVFVPATKVKYSFGLRHSYGNVEYDTRNFEYQNMDTLKMDFITLVRGTYQQAGSTSAFLKSILSEKFVNLEYDDPGRLHTATPKLTRSPSIKRKAGEDSLKDFKIYSTISSQLRISLKEIFDCISETKIWFVFHIRPMYANDSPNIVEIGRQVSVMSLSHLAQHPTSHFTYITPYAEFLFRYKSILPERMYPSDMDECKCIFEARGLDSSQYYLGSNVLFLSQQAFKSLEDEMGFMNKVDAYPQSVYTASVSEDHSETASHYSSEFEFERRSGDIEKGIVSIPREISPSMPLIDAPKSVEQVKKTKNRTKTRTRWLCFVYTLTWWIPPYFMAKCGLPRKDQQIAWREKVSLCICIFFACALILFIIAGLNFIICPNKKILSPGEAQDKSRITIGRRPTVYMYGHYYLISEIVEQHLATGWENNRPKWESLVLGNDMAIMFQKETFFQNYCPGFPKDPAFRFFTDSELQNLILVNHAPFRTFDLLPTLEKYKAGNLVWDNERRVKEFTDNRRTILTIYDKIYDISGFKRINGYDSNFIGSTPEIRTAIKEIMNDFSLNPLGDASNRFSFLKSAVSAQEFNNIMQCFDGLFLVAFVDKRQDAQCLIPNYLLLGFSILIVIVIGVKFLAALQFGTKRSPESHDKFVICQVPCYTEGEASLMKTLNSLAEMTYEDKHKLLFIIADGMIIGTGNDRPTPRIVLDILGVEQTVDPVALKFESIGEGNKQLNYAKVYSGLYEIEGHTVPYIVIVKVGQPSERSRPGNRGKRDSQMILMRFLSRVHYNSPMSPMELELYHHMKNIIGVDPAFYEYVLMVDADTVVMPDALNRFVSCMIRDAKVMGICGETQISNARDSFTTMIQVYEYFISHHLAKAFESLFGSVTCLPGCFCMYRVRTPLKNIPLLVSPNVIQDYAVTEVDTLHLKNLLHLGEDRYLTTLMLKHFPSFRLTFTPDAICKTVCPDRWAVLLSQRRRWINSTVHNLFELVFLPELCGFCCFSLRFVVFIDLFATIVQPATILYIIYLVFIMIYDESTQFPLISIILIAVIYGFQIVIFMLRREWDYLGWMIIYLLSTPAFAFYLPIYAFWHFDDFSWGNTRKVVGENSKAIYVQEIDNYDPACIALKKWNDLEYESPVSHKVVDSIKETGSIRSRKSSSAVYNASQEMYSTSVAQYANSRFSESHDAHSLLSGAHYANLPYNGQSRRNSNQGMNYYPQTYENIEMHFPSDEAIYEQVNSILSTADLMTITKKQIREQLSRYFNIDMTPKKVVINQMVDDILSRK